MSLMLAPQAPYMHPHFLPSSSLEGLEQVIPPEPNSLKIYIPRWKLDKPLPSPPERNSGIYSPDEHFLSSARYQRPNDRCREKGIYAKAFNPKHARSVDELRLFYSRQSPVPRSPQPRRREGKDTLSNPAKRARHSTEPVFQTCSGGPAKFSIRIDDKRPQGGREAPKRCSTSGAAGSANSTLSPRSKGIYERSRPMESGHQAVEPPRGVDNSELCFCHMPHPRHSKVFPNQRTSRSSSSRGVQTGDLPDAASYIELIRRPSEADVPEVTVEEVDNESFPSQAREGPSNRTQLYSFTTCASTSMVDELPETYGRKETTGFGLFRSPPLPPADEGRHRPRHLAIPPSDYQLYGAKALPKNKPKKKKSGLLPNYINKLIPKAIRRQASEPQMQSLRTPRTAPPCTGENTRSREEWLGLGRNSNAWRSTVEFSREAFGSSSTNRAEQKRKEELKSKIVMIGPTPHWV
ncbi:hypothetical protein MauCBS54593_003966 [Microsporum audouinii]